MKKIRVLTCVPLAACQLVAVIIIVVACLLVCLCVGLSVNKSLVTCSCLYLHLWVSLRLMPCNLCWNYSCYDILLHFMVLQMFLLPQNDYKIYGIRFTTVCVCL